MKELRYAAGIDRDDGSRHISGYALVFNAESKDLGGFTEVILPGSLDGVLEHSDVLCVLNHDEGRGVLGRFRSGTGSMSLTVDETGLRYDLDLPHTALGDEVLEGLRRGDISQSSFSFTVAEDEWIKRDDGSIQRRIRRFDTLYDVSPVYNPAYDATSVVVDNRGYISLLENNDDNADMGDTVNSELLDLLRKIAQRMEIPGEKPETRSDDEDDKDDKESCSDNEEKEDDEERSSDDPEDEKKEECSEDEEDDKESCSDEEDDEEKEEDRTAKNAPADIENRNINVKMNKQKFSLLNAINQVVNNRQFDDVTAQVIKEGRAAAAKSSIDATGQIVIPLEARDDAPATTVSNGILAQTATAGQEAIATETWDILGPLRDRLVIAQAGAQMLSLTSDVEIPIYSGSNVKWASEIGEAENGAGIFKTVKLSPKRITATLPISKMFLTQTSASAEALLRNDLINAVAEKLQKTILGSGAGVAGQEPAGLFNGVTADTANVTYASLVNDVAALETKNIGEFKYIVNPLAKAALRTVALDAGSGKFLWENDEILGVDAYSTNSVVSKGIIAADWNELLVASFGALDLTVDPYTKAASGQIVLVVNAYFDYVVRREEAFVKRILK